VRIVNAPRRLDGTGGSGVGRKERPAGQREAVQNKKPDAIGVGLFTNTAGSDLLSPPPLLVERKPLRRAKLIPCSGFVY